MFRIRRSRISIALALFWVCSIGFTDRSDAFPIPTPNNDMHCRRSVRSITTTTHLFALPNLNDEEFLSLLSRQFNSKIDDIQQSLDYSTVREQIAAFVSDSNRITQIQETIQQVLEKFQQQQTQILKSDNPLLQVFPKLAQETSMIDWQQPESQFAQVRNQLVHSLDAQIVETVQAQWTEWQTLLSTRWPELQPLLDRTLVLLQPVLQSPLLTLVVSTMVSFWVVGTVLQGFNNDNKDNMNHRFLWSPYPDGKYDPVTARAYFDRRPLQVLTRAMEIGLASLQFGTKVAFDTMMQNKTSTTDPTILNNKDNYESIAAAAAASNKNDFERGRELTKLLTQLGPTFIKVGQSLSIRTDLLSPGYIRGLATLQDQVPPFDTNTAKRILEQQLQRPLSEVFMDEFASQPVAAASLGQVYKNRLRATGETVAIKVQRPNILEKIALDMYLLREFAGILKILLNVNTDTVGTVDAWGTGFVDELDYIQEAKNAEFFTESIAQTPLKDVVFAPTVLHEYSTGTVLTTGWVDGERLDRSSSEDVTRLCSIAMNTYLTMLLELGLLHCDPHPGNLLRTPDGRLCIMDWGMVTRLSKNLQLTLIEHMAHLTSSDYAEVPRDLLLLGFVPETMADRIEDSGVVDVLADIYGAWTSGGGLNTINVNDVIARLQDLTAAKGNLFQIPPYFAYIAKSFSVLEGIGLSNDPKYSIIKECLPYVSQRMLTDKESMGPALSTFIFGPEKSKPDRIVDYKRVEQLVEGFSKYTTSASGALLGKENLPRLQLIEGAVDQILDLVVTEEETPLQDIFIEQLAKITTSSARTIGTQLRERSGTLPSGRTRLGTLVDPLGLFRTSPLVRPNELDEKTVETTRKLVALVQKQIRESSSASASNILDLSNLSREETFTVARILVRKFWQRRSSVFQTSARFARAILKDTAEKLEQGERDTRRIPERLAPAASTLGVASNGSDNVLGSGKIPLLEPSSSASSDAAEIPADPRLEVSPSSHRSESTRLANARKLLASLQTSESDDFSLAPDVTSKTIPVKTVSSKQT